MARGVRASVRCVLACAALVLPFAALAAENPGPRVSLLSSGTRASIVIELDGDGAKATAIEATDNQSVAVEIGPVQGKVANQRLKAADGSSLVSEVRVRGVTQGTDGTIITIQVLAKAPVSGSVRRAQRRVYIDLERRDGGIAPPGEQLAVNRTAAVSKPTSTAGTANTAIPSATQAAQRSKAAPQAAPASAASANADLKPVAAPTPRAATATPPPAVMPPATVPSAPAARPALAPATGGLDASRAVTPAPTAPRPASTDAPAVAVLPPPPPATGTFTPVSAPNTSTPGPRSALAAALGRTPASTVSIAAPATGSAVASPANPAPATSVPAPTAAVTRANAAAGSSDDLLKQGAALSKQSDVKGLERLKQTAVARLGAAASEADTNNDPTVAQIDRYLNEARQQRLLADAQLFRSQTVAAAPKPPATGIGPNALAGPSGGAQSPAPAPTPPRPMPAATRAAQAPSSTMTAVPAQAPDPTDAMLARVMPDVERMRDTLASWQPGYHASPTLPPQIDQLNAKLRELQPPAALASALTGLTSALTDLSSTWVPGPEGKLIPFRDDVRAVERSRTALTNFIDAAAALKLSSQR